MLRRPLSRSPFLRHFSASRATWNVQSAKADSSRNVDSPASLQTAPQADTKSDGTRTDEHLPTFSDSSSFSKPDARSLSPNQLDLVKQRLRSWTEQAAITLRVKADDFTASTKTTFSQLGSELNRVTGYDEIEVLKRGIVEQGIFLKKILHYTGLLFLLNQRSE